MATFQLDFGRQFKIVAASITLAVVAIAYVGYTYFSAVHAEPTSISPIQTGQGTTADESEHYSRVLRNYNRANAQQAEQNGHSYVSAMSSREEHVTPNDGHAAAAAAAPSIDQASPATGLSSSTPTAPNQYPTTIAPASAATNERFPEQIRTLATNWTPVPHTAARASALESAEPSAGGTATVPPSHPTRTTDTIQKLVPAFYLAPATLGTDIDTDENSWVSARVPSGEYEGAVVHAPGYKRVGNSVDMTFTFMDWRGHTYHINAKAVDKDTMRTALSGEVNNRYFSRVLLPSLALGLGKVGELFQAADTQTTVSPFGSIIQTRNGPPSARTIAGTILGGTAMETGQVLKMEAAQVPIKQVLVPRRETIGIQFIDPVYSTDDVDYKHIANRQAPADTTPEQQAPRVNQAGRPEVPPTDNGYSQDRKP